MILGLLLLVFLLGVGAVVLSRQPMWRELLHGPAQPELLPTPNFTRMAELEHEVWGDREHTNADIDEHCWTCHPAGTPESICALTPQTYWHHRDDIIGGAITNTPFAPAYRQHVEEEKARADKDKKAKRARQNEEDLRTQAAMNAAISTTYDHLVQHHTSDTTTHHPPPPDPGVHHHG